MKPVNVIAGILIMLLSANALAQDSAADEQADAHRWAAAKFEARTDKTASPPGLVVLANNDPVQFNARNGKPLRLAGKDYAHGLFCHAPSKVVVHLPGPGKLFRAVIGVDSNEQTSGGRGSVVFAVHLNDAERFRSELLREGMPPVPLELPLDGAAAFTLEVSDGGDGISCDQSDWAEAQVVLADGTTLRLGDLPLTDQAGEQSYTVEPPFSFVYGGESFPQSLADATQWKTARKTSKLDAARVQHAVTYTHRKTGLQVRCQAVEYRDFPTVEWTLYFKNTASSDTPLLENIQALDIHLERTAQSEFLLHHHKGSPCVATDYQPFETPLAPNAVQRITTNGGRPTNSDLPYFNIEWGGRGLIAVLGWPGQWAAEFARDAATGLRVVGGQELTHFVLHPGEEVRSPLVALQFYSGGYLRAQNTWRRWMIAHNLPRPGGAVPPSPQMTACSSHQFGEMIRADKDSQIFFADRYLEEKLPLNYWWMDAGWYLNNGDWPNTGTWEVDTKRFPGGLRAITDHLHERGLRSIVWFEPERVTPGTWLYEKHPEWLLGRDGEQKLLDLGNPAARAWLTDHIDGLLTSQGIDLYRQDFNMDPLDYWRNNDAPDRQGITEIRHVTGYLAYWDELRRRHPNMLIDSCASGGRRNDLETLRRAVPLLRSDFLLEPVSQQLHTYGIAFWIPFYGTGLNAFDPYAFRSQMCPNIIACYDMRKTDSDYEGLRRLFAQWHEIAPNYYGDYYPLTAYRTETDVWMAWQFNRPESGAGLVQAFRRADSPYSTAEFKLQNLDPEAQYTLTNLDHPEPQQKTGRELMEQGLTITLSDRPAAALITYQRLGAAK